MKDLSTGGASIRSSRLLTLGEVVTVSFFVTQDGVEDPDRPPFECAASIRWAKPAGTDRYDAGMQFLSLSAEQRTLLRGLLRQAA